MFVSTLVLKFEVWCQEEARWRGFYCENALTKSANCRASNSTCLVHSRALNHRVPTPDVDGIGVPPGIRATSTWELPTRYSGNSPIYSVMRRSISNGSAGLTRKWSK